MDKKLVVTAAIGAIVGLAIGYAVYALSSGIAFGIVIWLTNSVIGRPTDALLWAIGGAAVAAGLKYIFSR